jgi:hypothetical protein
VIIKIQKGLPRTIHFKILESNETEPIYSEPIYLFPATSPNAYTWVFFSRCTFFFSISKGSVGVSPPSTALCVGLLSRLPSDASCKTRLLLTMRCVKRELDLLCPHPFFSFHTSLFRFSIPPQHNFGTLQHLALLPPFRTVIRPTGCIQKSRYICRRN